MQRPSSQKNRLISRSQTLRSVFIFSTRSSHTPPLQDGAKVQQSHGKVCLLSSQTSRGVSREREARKRPPKRLLLGIATKSIGISEERDPCQSEGAVIWEERDLTVQIVISVTLCSWLLMSGPAQTVFLLCPTSPVLSALRFFCSASCRRRMGSAGTRASCNARRISP